MPTRPPAAAPRWRRRARASAATDRQARPAPPARPRPRAPAASRNRPARHRPGTWRRGRPSARPPRRSSLDTHGSRGPCPRDRAAPTTRSSRPDRRTSPSAAAARLLRWEAGRAAGEGATSVSSRSATVVGQRADRLQQEAAMAEGDAEILKIAIRQLRQHGGRDVVSRNAGSYRSSPSSRSQAAMFTSTSACACLRTGSLAQTGATSPGNVRARAAPTLWMRRDLGSCGRVSDIRPLARSDLPMASGHLGGGPSVA